jgi:hypothetical protein
LLPQRILNTFWCVRTSRSAINLKHNQGLTQKSGIAEFASQNRVSFCDIRCCTAKIPREGPRGNPPFRSAQAVESCDAWSSVREWQALSVFAQSPISVVRERHRPFQTD